MCQELIFDAGKETLHWAGSLRRAPFAWSAFGFLVSSSLQIFCISAVQSSIVLVGDSMQHSYLLEGSLLFSFE